jgi:hypothetical protein
MDLKIWILVMLIGFLSALDLAGAKSPAERGNGRTHH